MASQPQASPVFTAVVTGGHPFDVPSFHRLFRDLPEVDAYPQDLDNFIHDWGAVRGKYDVVVFYNMHMDTPEPACAAALQELSASGQGIVVLHHALLAWPKLSLWSRVCGIDERGFGYHMDQRIAVHVANPAHPITQGLEDWTMTDETYTMSDCGPDCDVLLTVDHPQSMATTAWTRLHGDTRIYCLQLGHDQTAWAEPGFRTVLGRGILWAAGRL